MAVKFSIIIPAHNEEAYLEKTLNSLAEQTFQNFETVVVANGCSDNTLQIAESCAQKNLNLTTLNLVVANVSQARNVGAHKAQGEILIFLDADTTLAPNALEKIAERFSSDHAVATTKTMPDKRGFEYVLLTSWKNFHFRTGIYKGCSGVLICWKKWFDAISGYDSELRVREHRKLILGLQKHGKYLYIPVNSTTSMRRVQRWGILKSSWFWTKQWFLDRAGSLEKTEYEKIR